MQWDFPIYFPMTNGRVYKKRGCPGSGTFVFGLLLEHVKLLTENQQFKITITFRKIKLPEII